MAAALLIMSLGGWSIAAIELGEPVTATVQECSTKLHQDGRLGLQTITCEVTIPAGHVTKPRSVHPAREHDPGDHIVLTRFRHSLSDPSLDARDSWLLLVGLATLAGIWWLGLPPLLMVTVGRHNDSSHSR